MSEQQVKVGTKYTNGSRYTAEVKLVTKVDDVTYVTYVQTYNGVSGTGYKTVQSTPMASFLSGFKVDDPFAKGATYSYGGCTYYVQEAFTISNPVSDKHRRMARVVVIDQRGKRWMDMVTTSYLNGMKRVK